MLVHAPTARRTRSAASPGLPYLQRAEVQWPWLIASQSKNPLGGEVDSPVCPEPSLSLSHVENGCCFSLETEMALKVLQTLSKTVLELL